MLLLVVLLAVESAAALSELCERLVARGAHKAVSVVLGAIDVADVRAAGNVLMAAGADVERGKVALLAVVQTGTRRKEVLVEGGEEEAEVSVCFSVSFILLSDSSSSFAVFIAMSLYLPTSLLSLVCVLTSFLSCL
jgi:hypothetical protein